MEAADRFCAWCGQPAAVTTPTDQLRLAQLNTVAPATLVEKIRSASLTSDRRTVTALFADVVGSTSLAEQLDPEEWTGIMNRAFEKMSVPIYQYEGTIARLLGDALLAFFGAPVAHEDDSVRAVHAACALIDVSRLYAEEVRRDFGIDFAVRVGINTGPVVVGQVGSDLKYEYTAMGDAMNLAARMQSAARPMTVLVTQHTYRFIKHIFEVRDLGPIDVKGKSEPVRAYEVLHMKHTPERARGLIGLESPLVGRDAELQSLIHLVSVAQAGAGRIALVSGEPGLGKSRLIAEWKEALRDNGQRTRWYMGQCLSYGQQSAYHLLISLLRSIIGVSAISGEVETHMALRAFLDDLRDPDSAEIGLYLAHLLSLRLTEWEHQRIAHLDPQSLHSQYLDAFRKIIRQLVQRSPLVIVLEDVHWADPSSVEVLEKLLPLVFQTRLLICIVSRDDRNAPGWQLIASARALMGETALDIRLQPLSEAASHQLVSNLLEIESLPEPVRALIHRKAEGNPFFIEEVIRMLIDEGMIVQQGNRWEAMRQLGKLDIPDNLLGILLARIDRQPDEIKQTMRIASVIGRQFPRKVLEQVLDSEEAQRLSERLGALETASLIRLAQVEPEIEYLFRHALIQDAAYESLLKRDRQRLHLAVGSILEQLYPDRLDELAPMLALHFAEGNDPTRACQYFKQAAENAERQFANAEAIAHYTRTIELTESHDYALPQLYRARGLLYENTGHFEEARHDHETAMELARAADNRRAEWRAALDLGMLWAGRDYAQSRTYFDQALALAERLGDPAALASSLNRMGNWLFNQNATAESLQCHQRALEIFQQLGDKGGIADTFDLLAMANWLGGDPVKGIGYYRQSVPLYRELGNPYGLSTGLIGLGMRSTNMYSYHCLVPNLPVDVDEMWRSVEEAIAITRSIGWRAGECFALNNTCALPATQGDYIRAFQQLDTAAAIAADIEHRQWQILTSYSKTALCVELWAVEAAQRALEPALALTQQLNSPYWNGMIVAIQAILLAQEGRFEEAESRFDEVIGRATPPQGLSQRFTWCMRIETALIRRNPRLMLEYLDFVMQHTEIGSEENELNYLSAAQLRGTALYHLIRSGEDTTPTTIARAEACFQSVQRVADDWPRGLLAWKTKVLRSKLCDALGRSDEARELLAQAAPIYHSLCQSIPEPLVADFQRGAEAFLND